MVPNILTYLMLIFYRYDNYKMLSNMRVEVIIVIVIIIIIM